jgi:N utilization substance protein A
MIEGIDLKDLTKNIGLIAEEKNLPEEKVIEVLEEAVAAAWRRDNGDREWKVRAVLNLNTGEATVYRIFEVVEEVEDDAIQLTLDEAKKIKKDAKFGDIIEEEHKVSHFGRIAAQTAKQVVVQKLREAECEVVFADFEDKVGEIITGTVSRITKNVAMIEIGRVNAIMPTREQIPGEYLRIGERIAVLLKEFEKREDRGTQMIVSRADAKFVKELFINEVPEIDSGNVEIVNVVREAGKRTKMSVKANIAGVDPVGSFVGTRGVRINAVQDEIGEERIDIILFDEDTEQYIKNALAPAEILKINITGKDVETKNEATDEIVKKPEAIVIVAEDQQAIAIGKGGQNVRLAGALTGFAITTEIDPTTVAATEPEVEKVHKTGKELEKGLVDLTGHQVEVTEEEDFLDQAEDKIMEEK